MRLRSFIFLILIALVPTISFAQDPAFPEKERKVVSLYDEEQNLTVVRFGPMHVAGTRNSIGELRLTAFYTYEGKLFVRPKAIGMIFRSVSAPENRWENSARKDLEIIADDKTWAIPNVQVLDSRPGGSSLTESLGVSLPYETFVALANAKRVKMRLGDRTFELTKQHLDALRNLARSI